MVDTLVFVRYNPRIANEWGIALLKKDVLYMLERQKGEIVTGGRLASALGVSRTAVWKAVRSLQDEGNEIVSVPNSGYRLLDTNDTLFEEIIREQLTTAFVGKNMTILPSVHSTNQYLKETDTVELPGGSVVIADEQTGGRGRRGRAFLSPKREGVYLSILLKLEGLQTDIRSRSAQRSPFQRPSKACAASVPRSNGSTTFIATGKKSAGS